MATSDLIIDFPELPSRWQVRPLGECLLLMKNGLTRRVEDNARFGFPVSRIQTLTDWGLNPKGVRYLKELTAEEAKAYLLDPGDILLSHINSEPQLGRSAIYEGVPKGLVHGMNLLRFKVHDDHLDAHFLNYLLRWYRSKGVFVKLAGRAVGQSSINQGKLKSLLIPVPPLAEQKAIAGALGTVQRARSATEDVLAAALALGRALRLRLFEPGLAPPVEGVPTPSSPGSQPWDVVAVGSLGTVRAGHAFPHSYQGRTSGKYPFYKVSDMSLPGNERVMIRANNYVDEDVVKALKAKPMPAGTVVFPKVGAALLTNKKRLMGTEGIVDNNIMGMTIADTERCRPEFLLSWLETIDLTAWSNPGPLPSITATTVKSVLVALPRATDQDRIVIAVRAINRKTEAEVGAKGALDSVFGSLLQDLVSGKRRLSPNSASSSAEVPA